MEQGGPHGRLDAAGLELLLRELLKATLLECEQGERLHIGFDHSAGHATLVLSCESGLSPLRDVRMLERLSTLAGQIGAKITAGERTLVSISLRPSEMAPATERERSVPRDADELSDGEAPHDVRSTRESHHGQTGAH